MRSRRVRALAIFTCLLSILVVTVSAYLRLSGAGLGCADWPDCYGRILEGCRMRRGKAPGWCIASSPRWHCWRASCSCGAAGGRSPCSRPRATRPCSWR
ncbi:MAG: COX15/CtaA family protein [Rhodocyclaceae bacterium]|nr:COX15/CtaA family protein [Rhodocyclaceae bacterium]